LIVWSIDQLCVSIDRAGAAVIKGQDVRGATVRSMP